MLINTIFNISSSDTMNVNIGSYYEAKLAKLIRMGIAASKTEALRMAVVAFERQLEDEEERLVVAKLLEEEKARDTPRSKWKSFDQVLKENKLDKSKL
jgi:Arc/MetJ-type ribon-helix-helix transcriptional regulator